MPESGPPPLRVHAPRMPSRPLEKTSIDPAFQQFLTQVRGREAQREASQAVHDRMIEAKSRQLVPIRQLLKRLMDMGVYVRHADSYPPHHSASPPQQLEIYEDESSLSWRPGTSLFLDHPGRIEISIPNESQLVAEGVVVLRCTSDHPDAHLLHQRFASIEAACMALATFLSNSTVRVERLPPK